jgi:Spy/CpxP family protein refolding chaperone
MTRLFKFIGLGALVSGLFWGSILSAYADDPATSGGITPAPKGSDHGWNNKGWGDMWKDKFGLSEDQSQKLKDLFKKQKEETQTLVDQMKVDMDTLKLKVDSKAPDDQIKSLLDNLSAEKKELQTKREHFMDQTRTILTPTQQAKFLLEKKGQRGWGGHGMWGHRGQMDGTYCPMGKGGDMGDKGEPGKHKGHMKRGGDASNTFAPSDTTVPAGSATTN